MTDNPAIITGMADDVESRYRTLHVSNYSGGQDQLYANGETVASRYRAALSLLDEAGIGSKITSRLTYKLVPRFGKGRPALRDQKIGGIPDLRYCLYSKQDKKNRYNTEQIWPVCGACHLKMKFIGQFDVLPWLLPIHAMTGATGQRYGSQYIQSGIGGRLTEHTTLYADKMLHVFACPLSGQHFDNPNYDAHIMVSDTYLRTPYDRERKPNPHATAEWQALYRDSIPKLKRQDYEVGVKSRKIEGWDLRFGFDLDGDSYGKDDRDYEAEERLEDVIKANPEVFTSHDDFTLFGEPRSQQTPRRYFSTNSYGGPQRMMPFLSFNDENHDVTYQIYADIGYTDGHHIFAKMDASNT